jgi:predicted phosphoribosyltransferase
MELFHDRTDAGRRLAEKLKHYAHRSDVQVLGLPRGGVPVAFEVATTLHAPLDVFSVRKLGVPGEEELAFGAVASGGLVVLNPDVLASLTIPRDSMDEIIEREREELERRERLYRQGEPPLDVRWRSVILVDDGLATGSSMRAAVAALRELKPERIVVAVPVAPAEACEQLRQEVDEVVCLLEPESFYAVGLWYDDFSPTTDDDVRELLDRSRLTHTAQE